MKLTSLPILRNKQTVGNNRKSYDDKHPENPISLRPIRDAIIARKRFGGRCINPVRLGMRSRPFIAAFIKTLNN